MTGTCTSGQAEANSAVSLDGLEYEQGGSPVVPPRTLVADFCQFGDSAQVAVLAAHSASAGSHDPPELAQRLVAVGCERQRVHADHPVSRNNVRDRRFVRF